MDEEQVNQHRDYIVRLLAAKIPRPTSREQQQAIVEALCCHAGCMFAAMNNLPYDVEGRPAEIATAALNGLESWKEQWYMRQ